LEPPPPVFNTTLRLVGPEQQAGEVSGFGGNRAQVGQSDELYAVERLQFGEKGDKGCFLKVESGNINDPSASRKTAQLDLCDGNGPTDRSLEYVPLLTTSHDTFIYGIGACTSKTENFKRLKGVRVYRAKIHPDGRWDKITDEDQSFDRPNCESWKTPVFCPDGWFANEVVVSFQQNGNDDIFTGLNLRCKKMEVTQTCIANCN
jgi:hypothetical protein